MAAVAIDVTFWDLEDLDSNTTSHNSNMDHSLVNVNQVHSSGYNKEEDVGATRFALLQFQDHGCYCSRHYITPEEAQGCKVKIIASLIH